MSFRAERSEDPESSLGCHCEPILCEAIAVPVKAVKANLPQGTRGYTGETKFRGKERFLKRQLMLTYRNQS